MIDIMQDEDGDLALVNGDLGLARGTDAIRQHCIQRLRLFKAEWFLDLDAGVPYYQNILVKRPNPIIVDGVLKDAITSTPGVIELLEFDLDYDNAARKLTLRFSARTLDGDFTVEEMLG